MYSIHKEKQTIRYRKQNPTFFIIMYLLSFMQKLKLERTLEHYRKSVNGLS